MWGPDGVPEVELTPGTPTGDAPRMLLPPDYLQPALQRARMQSYSVQCKSNLRQIGQAIHNYASITRGWLVPAWVRNTTTDGLNDETWGTILVNQKLLPFPQQGKFKEEQSHGDSVFRCPSGLNNRGNIAGVPGPPPMPHGPMEPTATRTSLLAAIVSDMP